MKKFIPAAKRNNTCPHFVATRTDRRYRPGYDRLTTLRVHPARLAQYARVSDLLLAHGGRPIEFAYFKRSSREIKYWAGIAADTELALPLRDYAQVALLEILAAVA